VLAVSFTYDEAHMFTVQVPLPPYSQLERQYLSRAEQYEKVLVRLHKELESLFSKNELHVVIKHRTKTFKNLYDKLCRRVLTLPESAGEIVPTDLLGIRIVCPFLSDVEKVEKQIDAMFAVTEKERKGADLGFQEFGYESVHFLIRCPESLRESEGLTEGTVIEIQVRTLLQEAWAEVEHQLFYKTEFSPLDEPLKRRLAALNANLTLSDIMFQEIRDYQENLRDQLRRRRQSFWDELNAREPSMFESNRVSDANASGGSIPRSNDQRLLEALLAHNKGDLARAVDIYTVILDEELRRNVRSIVYVHRGMANITRGNLADAERDFTYAVTEDPANSKGYLYRGLIEAMKSENSAALKDFASALQHDPFSQDALLERAKLHYRTGDLDGCRADCRRILDINPENSKARELFEHL